MEHGLIGWLFIIVALIFIFGGSKRLEDLGKGFGGFMREFSKAKREGENEVTKTIATGTVIEGDTKKASEDDAAKH